MSSQISEGCLPTILIDKREIKDPVLQVVEIKELPKKPTRFKLAVNDGKYFSPAMMSSQENILIQEGTLKKFSVIKLKQYNVNESQNGKPIIIILKVEVLDSDLNDVYGSPKNITQYDPSMNQQKQSFQQSSTPQPQQQPQHDQQVQKKPEQRPKPMRPVNQGSFLTTSALTPYINSWVLKAKIVFKSPMKEYNTARGSGKLFSVTLKDHTGEIRGTFFNDVAGNFYDQLEIEKTYIITGGRIKMANKTYSSINNDYEITFDNTTRFDLTEDDASIGGLTYNFVKLIDIETTKNSSVDVAAIILSFDPVTDIQTRNGSTVKRKLIVVDESGIKMEVTLWGDDARNFPEDLGNGMPIIIKDARVSDYHGKQLSVGNSSIVKYSSDLPEVIKLQNWYAENSSKAEQFTFASGSGEGSTGGPTQMIYLSEINEKSLGTRTDQADYYMFYGYFSDLSVSRNLYYNACPNPSCNNKGLQNQQDSNNFYCPRCQQHTTQPKPRFAFSFKSQDFSGSTYISALGDDSYGKTLFGYTAQEWANEISTLDEEKDKRKLIRTSFFNEFQFKCRIKAEEYNNESRPKSSVMNISPINYGEAAKFLAQEIKKF